MKLLRILAVSLLAAPVLPQTLDVDAALDKAGDYVTAYERTFAGVVAKETYHQDARGRSGTDTRGFAVEAPGQCATSTRSRTARKSKGGPAMRTSGAIGSRSSSVSCR